jgi:hypothetical protein
VTDFAGLAIPAEEGLVDEAVAILADIVAGSRAA